MRAREPFPVGKLPCRVLERFLVGFAAAKESAVVIGPRFGEDAAVIEFGRKYLVAKTDPITFAVDRIGWYAVHINANDIATLGARPRWFLATLLLPERHSTPGLVRRILKDILKACRELGMTLVGGHTEITAGLDRPIVVGQMLGEVEKQNLVRKESQQPGDLILLTKGIALEGTALLAREKARWLRGRTRTTLLRRAQRLLFRPGISVVREALVAVRCGGVHAMHDPTEGGLLSGLYELAKAGGVGVRAWKEKVPVLPETRTLSEFLRFDPFSLIASGALLVAAPPRSAERLLGVYRQQGIPAAIIGEIRPARDGMYIIEGNRRRPLRPPARDEIARILESSGNLSRLRFPSR